MSKARTQHETNPRKRAADRYCRFLSLSIAVLTVASGCGKLGPSRVVPGLRDYGGAVRESLNQQLLYNIVLLRFVETPEMLELSQIVSQFDLQVSGGVNPTFTVGGDTTVVPFSVGTKIGENPTLTYAPVRGEDFAMQMLAPMQPYQIFMLSRSGWDLARLLSFAVQRINGLTNLETSVGLRKKLPSRTTHDFAEVAFLLEELQIHHGLEIYYISVEEQKSGSGKAAAKAPHRQFRYAMVLRPDHLDASKLPKLDRLKELLRLNADQDIFPIVGTPMDLHFSGDALVIESRSMLSAMLYLAGGIHLPPPLEKEFPEPFAEANLVGKNRIHPDSFFKVQVSEDKPDDAYVAIWFRGWWFWISATDTNSKATFSLLQYLNRLQTARGSQPDAGVLLTIPTR